MKYNDYYGNYWLAIALAFAAFIFFTVRNSHAEGPIQPCVWPNTCTTVNDGPDEGPVETCQYPNKC